MSGTSVPFPVSGRRLLLRIGIAVLSILAALPASAQQEPPPGWRHYGPTWDGPWGWGWMFVGPLTMAAFVAAVVVLVALALRWISGAGHAGAPPPTRTPLEILKERFARGEIDKAEFEDRRRLLQD